MPIRLDASAPDFAERFRTFLAAKRETAEDVEAAVREIIADTHEEALAAAVFDGLAVDRVERVS